MGVGLAAGLLPPDAGDRNQFNLRPGDRVSTYGFWIFDCGHYPFKTELHPPVGVAVQRPRAVQIPASFRPQGFPNGFGSNVWVPGVVADIWFNRRSGGAGSCAPTSLHQPAPNSPKPLFCLRQPHSLNRRFTFNVYLPRSPQQRAQELGRNPPRPPLFVGIEGLSGGTGGPNPTYVVREAAGLTWLEVTVDLSSLRDSTYARRMTIGWAYPSPDNWGASRWRITLESLHAIEDAELFSFDEGDWRFHFNTNNRDQEWTPLFSCDGCIDDDTTYRLTTRPGGPHVRTGLSGGGNGSRPERSRNLGPDPVLFPDQEIRVHTTGYDDEVVGDDIGTVDQYHPQQAGRYVSPSSGKQGSYRLSYVVSPVGSVGPAVLTPEASALLRAHSGQGVQCTSAALAVRALPRPPRECIPAAQDPTFARSSLRRLETLDAYEAQGDEASEYSLTHISAARLRREFRSLRGAGRQQLLSQINRELRAVPERLRGDYNELALTLDRALPDRLVRRALPRALRKSVNRVRQRARALRRKRARQRARRRARRSALAHTGRAPGHVATVPPLARLAFGEFPPAR